MSKPMSFSANACALAEAKSIEPLRDVVRHGASLREARFEEAVYVDFEIFCTVDRVKFANRPDRDLRHAPVRRCS